MRRFFLACTLLIFCGLGFAEEIKQRKPSLGIGVEKNQVNFDGDSGVKVVHVKPGSNAQRMGILANDIITKINDQKIAAYDDAAQVLSNLRFDQTISIELKRNDKSLQLKGVIKPELGPTSIKDKQEQLEQRIAALKKSQPRTERYSLQELLIILRQIEQDLPAAAKEFKQTYPKGRFHISINIEIDSDTTQANKPEAEGNTAEEASPIKE